MVVSPADDHVISEGPGWRGTPPPASPPPDTTPWVIGGGGLGPHTSAELHRTLSSGMVWMAKFGGGGRHGKLLNSLICTSMAC